MQELRCLQYPPRHQAKGWTERRSRAKDRRKWSLPKSGQIRSWVIQERGDCIVVAPTPCGMDMGSIVVADAEGERVASPHREDWLSPGSMFGSARGEAEGPPIIRVSAYVVLERRRRCLETELTNPKSVNSGPKSGWGAGR